MLPPWIANRENEKARIRREEERRPRAEIFPPPPPSSLPEEPRPVERGVTVIVF